jgi:hypothetical protein
MTALSSANCANVGLLIERTSAQNMRSLRARSGAMSKIIDRLTNSQADENGGFRQVLNFRFL